MWHVVEKPGREKNINYSDFFVLAKRIQEPKPAALRRLNTM